MTRFAIVAALLTAGCSPEFEDTNDEIVDDTNDDTTDDDVTGESLEGAWVSEGDDISPLFQSDLFKYVAIDAQFATDGTYVVVSEDDSGATTQLTGTYTIDDSTDPAIIVLNQVAPYEAVAEGIYQIDGDELTYEVVQTTPDYGFAPPTPEAGFGSTTGPGMEPGMNVQIYVRD